MANYWQGQKYDILSKRKRREKVFTVNPASLAAAHRTLDKLRALKHEILPRLRRIEGVTQVSISNFKLYVHIMRPEVKPQVLLVLTQEQREMVEFRVI